MGPLGLILCPRLDRLQLDETEQDIQKKCTFSKHRLRVPVEERVDLSSSLEDSVIQLRKEVPQELVVNMFQKLVRIIDCHLAACPP